MISQATMDRQHISKIRSTVSDHEEPRGSNLGEIRKNSHPPDADETSEDEIDYDAGLDIDAPRVAQWEYEDDEEYEEDENISKRASSSKVKLVSSSSVLQRSRKLMEISKTSLEDDLSSVPLGALRKAQSALANVQADSDSDHSSSENEAEDYLRANTSLKGKEKPKVEWSIRPRPDLAKRTNKHAPQEVTSKRPVTRRRTVVEVKTLQPRDPRFLSVAGEFSSNKFQQQYNFLADIHLRELKTLRENLKRAKKLLASSPRDLREERQEEVNRLEMTVKRTESTVNKDIRDKVEVDALSQVKKHEEAKRNQGKGNWWMKESVKKEFLVRARYDALAARGGSFAVKKAIEKKQKKISQKEKKTRPFAREHLRPEDARDAPNSSRLLSSANVSADGRPFKKRRIES